MKWLDNFIVSKRGQWEHPGKPTAVPTKDGRITMQGVPYPVFAMDETGYGGMIYPGGNYQFPGKMVYEIPMAYGGDISIPDLSRPNWLDKYQGDEGSSQVKTYASDPNYFDNRAVFVDNPQANDLVRSKVYAGTHGWDPTTNSLVKLDKPVAIPEAVREMSTADYGKKNYKERFESNTPAGKEVRKTAVAQGMKDMVQNPLLYAPGAVAAGALAAPALAGVSGALSAPLTIGSTVIPGATMGNAIGALGAADALINRFPQIPGQLSRGEYLDAAINVGTGALDLYGANMVSPLFKEIARLPKSPNSYNLSDKLWQQELNRIRDARITQKNTSATQPNTQVQNIIDRFSQQPAASLRRRPIVPPAPNRTIRSGDELEQAFSEWVYDNRINYDNLPPDMFSRYGTIFQNYGIQGASADNFQEYVNRLSPKKAKGLFTDMYRGLADVFTPSEIHMMRRSASRPSTSLDPITMAPRNQSGLTKNEILARVNIKDKDKISKLSEDEFRNTVLKPNGEVVEYKPGTEIDQMTYDLSNRRMTLKDQSPMSNEDYVKTFNENLDVLNNIIAKNNKSGVNYKVKELLPNGQLIFSTPAGQKGKNPLINQGLEDVNIPEGESSWMVGINPGQWKGNVEDIANTEYFRSIPGLEMSNTTQGVFSDRVPRRGSGAYDSLNEYLKTLGLGRVKPGFNSQTPYSRGAWENFINSGRAFGFYGAPNTVYGTMRTVAPYAIPTIAGAAALQKEKYGGWLDRYQDGSQVPANFFWIDQDGQFRDVPIPVPPPKTFEEKVDDFLGNPQEKAMNLNRRINNDNLRHSAASMHTTESLGSTLGAAILAQGLGAAHEISSLPKRIQDTKTDDVGYYDNIYHNVIESGEDVFNNAIGSMVGMIPFIPTKAKESLLVYLSNNNMLPDGKSMPEGNEYVPKKKSGGWLDNY